MKPGTGALLAERRTAIVVSTRLPFSLARAARMRVAFLRRAYEALGRSRRHREVTARIAASQAREPGPGAHVTRRLHRCPWCGAQAAFLFSCEMAYPEGDLLSERWRCAHCGGDHVRAV